MMLLDQRDDEPTGGTQCRECGRPVSNSFARVFGDNDNRVYGCLTCTTSRKLSEGCGQN